jgi:thiol:disulfide interchange protein DsbD
MIKMTKLKWLFSLLLSMPTLALAVQFDEVKPFNEVFSISAQADSRNHVNLSWDIAEGYYLYNNKFLKFASDTQGVALGEAEIPEGERKFDELLGEEVVKYHDRLTIGLPLTFVPVDAETISLKIRSQGCLEDVLCYPPTEQLVTVNLPAALASLSSAAMVLPGLDQGGLNSNGLAQGGLDLGSSSALVDVFNPDAETLGQDLDFRPPALTADEAFIYEAIGFSEDSILVRITVEPGYYLYRNMFDFRVLGDSGIKVRSAEFPKGKIKDDPEFGNVEVFYGQIEVPVSINRPAGPQQTITLEADYQGCRDGDICYPPQTHQVELTIPAAAFAINEPVTPINATLAAANPTSRTGPAASSPMQSSEQDKLAEMLLSNPTGALFAFFIAGLLLAFTPCVFPMVPILSGIIAGQGDRMTTGRAFWLSLVYVLAMAVTYTIAGVLAGLFGQNLQALFQNPWILSVFIGVFIALALSMFGFFELQLPARLQTRLTNASNQQKGGSLTGVAVMGFLSALIVGPCVAPPLAAALIVIGASGSAVLGGSALFALSMGMGLPLILFGVSAGKLVPKAGAWMDAIKAVFGIGLLALAIWMLERIVQGPVILLLWGILAIASGVYMGALERVPEGASGWHRLWKSLGLVLLLIGAMEIIGAAKGGEDWTKPLKGFSVSGTVSAEHGVEFERIKSLQDLDAAVAVASQARQPAMLDFYADWCIECVRMERNTFTDPTVQKLMAKIRPLQADVTPNDKVDQALMSKYGVIGPPAILFFDRQGNELRNFRLVGYFEPEEFAAHLNKVLATP